ncbi:MAG: DEAD/DEAH box helicase family protein [Acidimicrobiaceae bacterium]|nr:DEAD/DEAH box helicase family protein [Acidimicrobiaceae bacterium]
MRASGGTADDTQRAVLGRWSGWGALPELFDARSNTLRRQAERVEALLSPDEYEAARASTINAHYTSPEIAAVMWAAAAKAGFSGGRVLEPGCGPGVFMATSPPGLDIEMTGVERDPVTAQICALLHPAATVVASLFEKYHTGGFNLVVGNVPFADVTPHDPYANGAELALHNYFLAKSLQLLDPGGLLVAITSSWTLDALSPDARLELARHGRFLGAVRLPNGAFEDQSGTKVMTDVVMFQRRREPLEMPKRPALWDVDPIEAWYLLTGGDDDTPSHNRWYAERPELVLGEMVKGRGLYGRDETMVNPRGGDLAAQLGEALAAVVDTAEIEDVPSGLHRRRPSLAAGPAAADGDEEQAVVRAPPGGWPPWAKEGSLLAVPGSRKFAQMVAGRVVEYVPKPRSDTNELRRVIAVRDAMAELIAAEAADEPEGHLDGLRRWLNVTYDTYTGGYGPLNRGTADRPAGDDDAPTPRRRLPKMGGFAVVDPDYPAVLALEVFDPETGRAAKSEIFHQRVVRRPPAATRIETLSDAVVASVAALGRIDIAWMAGATDWEWEPADLAADNVAYRDPAQASAWEPAPLYLSGNVREKLAEARSAAEHDTAYEANVAALEPIIPTDVGAEDIALRLGATWLSVDDIEEFICDTLGPVEDLVVTYSPAGGWNVEGVNWTRATEAQWGTDRISAISVVEHGLRGRPIVITDRLADDRRVVNEVATAAANEKLEAWQAELHRWAFGDDPERRSRLLRAYNDTFRSWVAPQVGPEWINPPGLREGLELHPHQREAAARVVLAGDLLLAHEVGAGKTLTMAVAGMEMKRLGMVSKACHVVPNHLVEQYAGEIRRAFPQAKVLIPFEAERTSPEGRKQLIARCANDDWDAVVIPLTTFRLMPVSPEVEANYISDRLAEWRDALTALKEGGARRTIKRIEKRIEAERAKLEKALERTADDGTLWEHTGIDFLFVDEAHHYKSLPVASSNPDFATSQGSVRARLMEMNIRWLRETYPERRAWTVMATGTPVANRVAELWVMQRYVQPDHLARCGVAAFDAWAAAFGRVVTGQELRPTGKGWRTKSRFAAYCNVPELMQLVAVNADFRRAEDMGLQRPALDGGKPQIVPVPGTEELHNYVEQLVVRSENLSGKDPREDNMLLITSDGRKAALHLGLVGLPQGDPSKVEACAAYVHAIWSKHADRTFEDHFTGAAHPRRGALQVVFCDMGVPGSDSAKVCVYDLLTDSLERRGVPRDQIAAIHDYDSTDDKQRLYTACRDGSVSVLLASTEKAGTGVNIQTRLAAMHHLDAAWRPADIEQREGRILRPGNQFDEVQILRYVTEGSFDTYMWQGLERKARFIGQLFAGRCDQRTVEEIDEATLNYAQVKAAATGDPRVVEHAEATAAIAQLSLLKAAHDAEQTRLGRTLRHWEEHLPSMRARLDKLRTYPQQLPDGEALTTTEGHTLAKPSDADKHLRRLARDTASGNTADAGEIAGLTVRLRLGAHYQAPVLVLGEQPAEIDVHFDGGGVFYGTSTRPTARLHHEIKAMPQRIEMLAARVRDAEEVISVSRSRLGEPFAKLAELTAAQSRAAALQEAIEASAAEERAQAEARTETHADDKPDEPGERSEYLKEMDRIGAEFAEWRHKRKMGQLANSVAALRDKRKAETDTQTRIKDIAHPERHDYTGAHAGVEDLDDEPCAVCGMDRPYHDTECPEHLRERALAAGLSEAEMDEVLASDSDLPGYDLDGRFWWDSDYSDHDPGTSSADDEPCAVCGMDRSDHEAGCPERLRRYGHDGRGGIAIS